VSHLLARAEVWKAELDRGAVRSAARIAHREGFSQVYVGRLLSLLKLHPDILAAILEQSTCSKVRILRQILDDERRERIRHRRTRCDDIEIPPVWREDALHSGVMDVELTRA
jgi:hypothetical protein